MPQLTLAAHYGPKVKPEQLRFAAYARACQDAVLHSELGRYFAPYAAAQLHGTLVGLEAVTSRAGSTVSDRCNANLYAQTGELRAMNFDCVLGLARALPPLTIRFGGFQPGDKIIASMGADAFTRSLQIQWRQGKVVIIGWHHVVADFAHYPALWALRRAFGEACGVAHKYVDDSDFFVTIGDLWGLDRITDGERTSLYVAGGKLETALRQQLAAPQQAIDLAVRAEHLSLVRYYETSLNPATSEAYPVTDPRLDAHFLTQLYCS